jgi:antitoxin VapB
MTKPIQIRRPDTVNNIRALAAMTGEPITDAVDAAVRSRLEEISRREQVEQRRRRLDELIASFQEAVAGKPFPTDDDFYDELGLPK